MTQYVIIGNGVAGNSAAEQIRGRDGQGPITVISDEDIPFYSRIRLNEYVAGDIQEQDLIVKKHEWYEAQQIKLRLKTRIVGADASKRVMVTADHEEIPYDRLLMAAGSHSFVPPIKGADRPGVYALRSVQDARNISSWAKQIKDAVLIGGGLLGLEAGNALRRLGKKVMVVEFFPRLLPRQLDVDGARRLQALLEEMGFAFRLGAKTEAITGGDRVGGVRLEGGEALNADMVIISAGVRPNLELAEPLGLETDKGIKVDDHLQTNQSHIYAAGDVAEFRGFPYGIWTAAMEQGKIAGTNMAGGDATYGGTTMANTLKVVGVDLASAGDIDAENELESRVATDGTAYQKIVIQDNRIVGCIMLGDTKGFNKIREAISQELDVSRIKDRILTPGFDMAELTRG
jgi:nitrite reductase (NADH) large subunit